MSFIYVASPYSHPDAKVRAKRYTQVCFYVVGLMGQRKYPYSPIAANHHMAKEFNLQYDAASWMSYNFAMLSVANELHILQLEGWQDSVGITAEIAYWRGAKQGFPMHFIEFDWTKLNSNKNVKSSAAAAGEYLCAPTKKGG